VVQRERGGRPLVAVVHRDLRAAGDDVLRHRHLRPPEVLEGCLHSGRAPAE